MTDDVLPTSHFLADWLYVHADRTPDSPAIASAVGGCCYGELADRVRTLSGHLAARGVEQGTRVLLALPNTPATIVAGLALNTLGAVSVELSRDWGAEVLGAIAARCRVDQAFLWHRDAEKWRQALGTGVLRHAWVVSPVGAPGPATESFAGSAASRLLEDGHVDPTLGDAPPAPSRELDADAPALVLYTSGSTGRPHGVVQTFRNLDANSRSIVKYLGLTAHDRALLTLPLYYCYGRSVLQTHLLAGGSVVLENRTAFPRVVVEAMGIQECTGFAGVPLTFEVIRRQVDVATIPRPRLRYLTQAGGAMAPDTIRWAREAFRPARLFVMYGQTEATARLSYLPPERADDKEGSIGIPIPGVELRVVDERGVELPPGEIGELVARGANVTPGYLDEPEETAAILRDGWLWTGDLAARDADGYLYHRGRAKEILKVGGHRASPLEIEQAIERHPDVAEAAVIGVSDPIMGEVPLALIVRRAGAAPDESVLTRFCRERMPPYLAPTRFVFVDALPRNEAGKLLRNELLAAFRSAGEQARRASDGVTARDST